MAWQDSEGAFCFEPIGVVRSCFSEKFGVPRQPGIVPAARAVVELSPACNAPQVLRGLEEVSHVWLVFVFHLTLREDWKAMVRPPRLGGNRRVGVFASRSPFRPNPIGMSVLKLEEVESARGRLHLSGVDLVNGTPVLDIKPYLRGVDAVTAAQGGYTDALPERCLDVRFTTAADADCRSAEGPDRPDLRVLIEQILRLDPRPAYVAGQPDPKEYGIRLFDLDVKWRVEGDAVEVLRLEKGDSAA